MLFDHSRNGGNAVSFEKRGDVCGCTIVAEKWNRSGVSEIKITLFREEIEQLQRLLSTILEKPVSTGAVGTLDVVARGAKGDSITDDTDVIRGEMLLPRGRL